MQLIRGGRRRSSDIGGESTRPWRRRPISAQQEIDRILPVVEGLKTCGVIVSVDTFRAATMKAALAAGAKMINDITALRGDPESMGVVAAAGVPICLMHMQGEPGTMQDNPVYEDGRFRTYSIFLKAASRRARRRESGTRISSPTRASASASCRCTIYAC